MATLFTIGHSNHPLEIFLELLERHAISALADVRSSPYSRFNPQFNRELLQPRLKDRAIAYVYLGDALGPRSDDPACYVNGKVQYRRLAATEKFRRGLERLRNGMSNHRVALMCAEKDPIGCHRMILICRELRSEPMEILHILEDGSLESLAASEQRLLKQLRLRQLTLFDSVRDLILRGYDQQAEKIAYRRDDPRQASGSEEEAS